MSNTGLHSTVAKPNEQVEDQKAEWSEKATDLGSTQKMLQTINFKLGNFDDENRSFRAIASTPLVDRQGDSIEQSGWVLDNFVKNPVIPWAHCYWELPVARATEVGVVDGNLQMTVQFPPEGLYDFADTVWNMYRNGFMFAFSVGFIPLEYEGNWEDGYNFTKCELLEVSAVPVPANAGALVLAQKMGVMDSKSAKQMVSKVELALNNLKELNGMPKKDVKDTKTVEQKDSTELVPVTMENMRSMLKELLSEEQEEAEETEEENSDDSKSLTNNDSMVQTDSMTEQKSGAKISAATKAKIKEVMDGLEECMVHMKAHHTKLGDLYNVGADSEDGSDDEDESSDTTDGAKSVENSKPKADNAKKEVVAEVKSADVSDDGAEQEDVKEDESTEDKSTEEETKEEETTEEKSVEETSTVETKADDDTDSDEDLLDPENLSDEDVAKIAAAVQAELDKINE